MAYSTSNPPRPMGKRVTGDAPCLWFYRTDDPLSEVVQPEYFRDGFSAGLRVGDVVMVQNPDGWSTDFLPVTDMVAGNASLSTPVVSLSTPVSAPATPVDIEALGPMIAEVVAAQLSEMQLAADPDDALMPGADEPPVPGPHDVAEPDEMEDGDDDA